MKLYYFYTSKVLWDGQGKIKMYYGMSSVEKKYREKVLLYLSPGLLYYKDTRIKNRVKRIWWSFLVEIENVF